jgi:predicted regulator of Ras-like GTPase activity (Roadblock/LC7/MglB family)
MARPTCRDHGAVPKTRKAGSEVLLAPLQRREALYESSRSVVRREPTPRPGEELFMTNPQMVMYEEEFNQIQVIVSRLVKEANARVVFIIDKNGQLIAQAGDTDQLDSTSLASLTAGNIAATGGMAKLLRENEFTTQFHEGEKQNIHIQLVGNRVILVVIFDNKTSLGLVRLRVKKASEELNGIFEALLRKVQDPTRETPFAEITDDDIDNLFND